MTNFHDEVVLALKSGTSFDELRKIVLRHKAEGLSQRETFDVLESIWLNLGCNKDEADENPLCEGLGDIMDQVWGYCHPAQAIWETALSEVKE